MAHISVNGVELYYESTGEGDPLVLVHGGWSDHLNWQAVAPTLAESFRVVTYDRRGHSQSERPPSPGSRQEDEDDLAALIEALECAPAHLVGNSWGGSTVIGLSARRPELVRSVTAHEPPLMSLVTGDPEFEPLIHEAQTTIKRVLEQLEQGDIEGGTRGSSSRSRSVGGRGTSCRCSCARSRSTTRRRSSTTWETPTGPTSTRPTWRDSRCPCC